MVGDTYDEHYSCRACGSPVSCEPAGGVSSDYDYDWACSNRTCVHATFPEGTGDMETPAWVIHEADLRKAQMTDPRDLIDVLQRRKAEYQDRLIALDTAGFAPRWQQILAAPVERYHSAIGQIDATVERLTAMIADGQPWDYRVILDVLS